MSHHPSFPARYIDYWRAVAIQLGSGVRRALRTRVIAR
jgi:hypothetical protein